MSEVSDSEKAIKAGAGGVGMLGAFFLLDGFVPFLGSAIVLGLGYRAGNKSKKT